MKFILFVEGHTENKAIPSFLKQWLDPKLSKPVGIKSVRFEGWPELVKDSPTKANLYLSQDSVIAVIALLDLYGPTIYPDNENTAKKRYLWAKRHLEKKLIRKTFINYLQFTKWKLGCLLTRPYFQTQSNRSFRSYRNPLRPLITPCLLQNGSMTFIKKRQKEDIVIGFRFVLA